MPEKQTVASLEALGIGAPTAEDLTVPMLEGLDFGADSFIAQWTFGRHYGILTQEDYIEYNRDDPEYIVPQPDLPRVELGDWYQMFYKNKGVADKVYEALTDGEYSPRLYWAFTAPSASMKNSVDLEKFVSSFGDTLLFWVRVVALDKGNKSFPRKDRHEYNFVSLPSAVQALADVLGMKVPAYDLSLLSRPDAGDEFDEEFFVKHFGHADGAFADCTFAGQRAALWSALGEGDLRKTSVKGSEVVDKKGKRRPDPLATESDKLSKCLTIAQSEVTLWARVIRVPNPAADVFEKQAPKIVAVDEIFVSEEDATRAGIAELAEKNQQADSGSGQASHPPLGGWTGGKPSDVVAHLVNEGILDQVESATTPPARSKLVADAFLDSWEDLQAWEQYAKDNG